MSNKGQLLQDPFLNLLRKEHVPVSIYLVNGIKLQGHIESFDQYVVLLRNTVTQMVYKHAISTVVPGRAVNFQTAPTPPSSLTRAALQPADRLERRASPSAAPRGAARAILVGVDFGAGQRFDATLDELALLAESAGDVAGRARRRPAQGARRGALRRLGQGRRDQGAGRSCTRPRPSIFDQALSPAQQRNLERASRRRGRRPHDADPRDLRRSARRATKASCRSSWRACSTCRRGWCARWSHLERQRGGIGTRGGPGEAQIELDRRMIGERIKTLKKQLEQGQAPAQHAARARASATGPSASRWSATPTPASRRCSTRWSTPRPTPPTSCSRRSTRRRASCTWRAGARGRRCPTRSASSATCRTRWSRRSRRRCRKPPTPTCCCTSSTRASPELRRADRRGRARARPRSAPTTCRRSSSSTRSTASTRPSGRALCATASSSSGGACRASSSARERRRPRLLRECIADAVGDRRALESRRGPHLTPATAAVGDDGRSLRPAPIIRTHDVAPSTTASDASLAMTLLCRRDAARRSGARCRRVGSAR